MAACSVLMIVGLVLSVVVVSANPTSRVARQTATDTGTVQFTLLSAYSPSCLEGLSPGGTDILLEYRLISRTTFEVSDEGWSRAATIVVNSTAEEGQCTSQPVEAEVRPPGGNKFIQFRVVQLEHGGGRCNCWGVTNFSVVFSGLLGGSPTVNLTGGCDLESVSTETPELSACLAASEQMPDVMFCGGSASVPRGVVSTPHQSRNLTSSPPCDNVVNGSHVSDPLPPPSPECATFPRIDINFTLDFLTVPQRGINVDCRGPGNFDEGVELAVSASGDVEWTPLFYYTPAQPSISVVDHDIVIGAASGNTVSIRGQPTEYSVNRVFDAESVSLCGEDSVRDGLQVRWLQTTSFKSGNLSVPSNRRDMWVLDNVTVTLHINETHSVDLLRSSSDGTQLLENTWVEGVRNGAVSGDCGGSSEDTLLMGATCTTPGCGSESQITASRLVTTTPLNVSELIITEAPTTPPTTTSTTTPPPQTEAPTTTPTPPPSTTPGPTTPTTTSGPSTPPPQPEASTTTPTPPPITTPITTPGPTTSPQPTTTPTPPPTTTPTPQPTTTLTPSSTTPTVGLSFLEVFEMEALEELNQTTMSVENMILSDPNLARILELPPTQAAESLKQLVEEREEMDSTVTAYLLSRTVLNAGSAGNLTDPMSFGKTIHSVANSLLEDTNSESSNANITGSSLLALFEELTSRSLNKINHEIAEPNVRSRVRVFKDSDDDDDSFTSLDLEGHLIQLPRRNLRRLANDSDVRVTSSFHLNLNRFLPGNLPRMMSTEFELASPVLSTALLCGDSPCGMSADPTDPSQVVTITVAHDTNVTKRMINDNSSEVMCVFWEFIGSLSPLVSGRWDTEGCVRNDSLSNSTHTVCECTHLTNFAILLSARPLPLPSSVALSLSIIGYIGVGLSVLAMLATIVSLLFLRSLWSMRNFIHINLCVSLILAQLMFVIGVTPHEGGEGVGPGCRTAAVIMHYLFLVSFMWMLMEGVVLYVALVRVFVKQQRRYMIGFFVFSYGAPLLYMVLCVPLGLATPHESGYGYGYIQDDNETTDTPNIVCWLNPYSHFVWAFIAPVLVVILVNVGFFIMALVIMHRHSKRQTHKSKMKSAKNWIKGSVSLVVVMGITWIIGILVFEVPALFPLAYIFTIFVAFQGVAIFIIFVLLSKQVREAYSKWWKVKVAKSEILSKRFGEWTTSSSGGQTSTRMGASSPNGSTLPRTSISQLEASTAPSYADYDTNGVTETKKQVPTLTRQGTSFDVTYVTTPTKKSFFDSEESSEGANGHVGNGHTSEFNVDYAESAQTESTTV